MFLGGASLAAIIAAVMLALGGTPATDTTFAGPPPTDITNMTCTDAYLAELNTPIEDAKPVTAGDPPFAGVAVQIALTYTQHDTSTNLTHAVGMAYNGGIPGAVTGRLDFPVSVRCATIDKVIATVVTNPANPSDPQVLAVTDDLANPPVAKMIVYWNSDNVNQAGFYHVDAASPGSVTLTRIVDGACNSGAEIGDAPASPGILRSCVPTNKGIDPHAYLNSDIVKAAALTGEAPRTPATQCPDYPTFKPGSCFDGSDTNLSLSCGGTTGFLEGPAASVWTRTETRTIASGSASPKVADYGIVQLFNPTSPKTCADIASTTGRSTTVTVVWTLDSADNEGDESNWDSDWDKDGCLDYKEHSSPLPAYENAPPIAGVDLAYAGRDAFNPNDCDRNLGGIWDFEITAVPVSLDGGNERIPGSYYHCRLHITHDKGDNSLGATMLCYTDDPAIDVNVENSPHPVSVGDTGDGFTGSPFPIGSASPPAIDPIPSGDGLYADVPSAAQGGHAKLTGSLDKTNDRFSLEGCVAGVASSEGPNMYFRFTNISGRSGHGTADIWRSQSDCAKPGGAATFAGVNVNAVQHAAKDEAFDFDLDGCNDDKELGDDPNLGGLRDPFNPWDRQDVNKDGHINVPDDILVTAANFGPATSAIQLVLDRSGRMNGAAGIWNRPGQDGTIGIVDDILGTAAQFGHTCFGTE